MLFKNSLEGYFEANVILEYWKLIGNTIVCTMVFHKDDTLVYLIKKLTNKICAYLFWRKFYISWLKL